MNPYKHFFLGLFLAIGLANGEPASAKCKELFKEYKLSTFEELSRYKFKNRISITIEANTAAELYKTALNNLSEKLNFAQLEKDVIALKKTGVANKDVTEKLKVIRKQASVVRSMFKTLSVNQKIPTVLQDFTRDFGKLNDAIATENKGMIREAAKVFLKSMNENAINETIHSFQPAPRNQIETFLSEQLQDAVTTIEDDKISIKKLHEVRKDLKDFLAIYTVLPKTPAANEVRNYLTKLNDQFGKINDEITTADLFGDLDYKKTEVRIYKTVRKAVKNFTDKVAFDGSSMNEPLQRSE